MDTEDEDKPSSWIGGVIVWCFLGATFALGGATGILTPDSGGLLPSATVYPIGGVLLVLGFVTLRKDPRGKRDP
ncbi:MAG: hypothetical protein JWP66_718 [Naasia sp.]|nr:hypothetical protein [Naasia sp.]